MAAAMARGWARADEQPEAMLFCDAGSGRAATLAAELGGESRETLAALADDSDLVVLAVKPGALDAAAAGLEGRAEAVLSVLVGTPIARLRTALGGGVPLFRTVPNVAVEVGAGVICQAPPDGASEELAREVGAALGRLGSVVEVEERLFDAATAVMSCGPAFVAVVTEAISDAAVREGLDAALAHELVVDTLSGTAALLREHDTLAVRRAVTSPGGMTAAGLAALEAGGVRASLGEAVRAAVGRLRG
jgi:pyrroline-5-carboxylate reductase